MPIYVHKTFVKNVRGFQAEISNSPRACAEQFHTLIQEIKRNMVFRRCNRLVNNSVGGIDQHRVGCHLTINVQRVAYCTEAISGQGGGAAV